MKPAGADVGPRSASIRKDPCVLRTDTGNYNRFLTSLGLLLLAGALVIPYFYFRNTEVLSIPDSDLHSMTETGRSALTGRQDAIASLEPWIVAIAVLLAAVGVLLLVIGGLRLKSAQESEDEETELRKSRARLEMRRMSPEERAEKATERAQADVDLERESKAPRVKVASPRRAKARPARASRAQSHSTTTALDIVRERQRAIARVEGEIEDVFGAASFPNHRLKLQVKLSSVADAIRLDGVFESRSERLRDVVLKTRIVFGPGVISRTARTTADELVAQLSRYESMTGRRAVGWLVTVVASEAELNGPWTPDVFREGGRSLRTALVPFGKAFIVREEKLNNLPAQFSREFDSD